MSQFSSFIVPSEVKIKNFHFKILNFQACLYLYDVPSVEHPGRTLGSVVFGESFLDSAVRTLVPGKWCRT